ncbi:MAG: TRL-like family protein [Candidatus Sumerlaeota bacterium]|nr:TRL-like family protein [Candidatus Sumerlaeota bacterium]
MAKKIAIALIACMSALTFIGCLRAPVMPPVGLIYNEYMAPLSYEGKGLPLGSKSGTASTESILGLVAWGDASLKTAAANGRLTKINHVDYEYLNVIGVYQHYTTVAYGE